MNGNKTFSDELLSQAISALLEAPLSEDDLAEGLAQTRRALAQAHTKNIPAISINKRIWRTLMQHKKLTLSSAAALVICIGVGIFLALSLVHPSVAFSEVIERMSSVQTIHAKITQKGISGEVWAKRPNKLRLENEDGTFEISNGPIMWIVNPGKNTAVRKPSIYYTTAQKRGVDVVDIFLQIGRDDDLSGFFSEKPVERVRRNGTSYDVYRMKLDRHAMQFEAYVDIKTGLLSSLQIKGGKAGPQEVLLAIEILEYDLQIPESKFRFEPPKGMKVRTEQDPASQLPPVSKTSPSGRGSSLSGRVVWATSEKPVPAARLSFHSGKTQRMPDGRSVAKFFQRTETDRDGRWRLTGVPAGRININVRSWELEWPSVPAFKGNIGSPRGPRILVDGKNDYDGLDFHVHKPEEFFATVTLRVTDEEGRPVEGIGARLSNGQNVYAARGKQYSGASGKFFAEDIWPTDQPVQIKLYSRGTNRPYAIWAIASKPFVVESKGRYHFDLVLPSARSMVIQVVSPKGEPLEGIKVIVYSESLIEGHSIRIFSSSPAVRTDAKGHATISNLPPQQKIFVSLYRMPISAKPTRPVASAVFPVRIPKVASTKPITFVFDDRPILIEGILESPVIPDGEKLAAVYCTKDGHSTHVGCRSTVKNGRFKLQGPPAGQIRFGYTTYNPSERIPHNKDCQGELEVEPGFAYAVKIIGDRLEVIRKSKLEEKKP